MKAKHGDVKTSAKVRVPSLNRSQTQVGGSLKSDRHHQNKDGKRPPKFMQKIKIGSLVEDGTQLKAANHKSTPNAMDIDSKKADSAKQTPNTQTLEKIMDHHGSTASFAIKETFDKIQAKLESAQRR